jgi:phosphatidate cytidylyltransferase
VLKARLISAAILVPLVVYVVLGLPTPYLALAFGAVLLLAGWEWSALVSLRGVPARLAFCGVLAATLALLWQAGPARYIVPLLALACAWWLVALFWLTRPQLCATSSVRCILLKLLAGLLVCVPPWASLVVLHQRAEHGPELVLTLLVTVWLADSGAYFAGRRFGRHKLAPQISPGKTLEGVYGGLLASLLFAAVAGWALSGSLPWMLSFVAVALAATLFSVAGDLLESLMKRQSGIKDSGHIIPGHGGIFDRIDSLVAAAPVFLSGLLWLGL